MYIESDEELQSCRDSYYLTIDALHQISQLRNRTLLGWPLSFSLTYLLWGWQGVGNYLWCLELKEWSGQDIRVINLVLSTLTYSTFPESYLEPSELKPRIFWHVKHLLCHWAWLTSISWEYLPPKSLRNIREWRRLASKIVLQATMFCQIACSSIHQVEQSHFSYTDWIYTDTITSELLNL